MQHNSAQVSGSKSFLADGKDDLFTTVTPALSSQINGGYWSRYSSNFPVPPRRYSYGRLPAHSHAMAAQRLNEALFA